MSLTNSISTRLTILAAIAGLIATAGCGHSPKTAHLAGTITVTGNYSTIPESHGGKKYRGAAIGGGGRVDGFLAILRGETVIVVSGF